MVLLVKDLKALAKSNKIRGYGKMKKAELINMLIEKDIIKEEDVRKKPKKAKEIINKPEEETIIEKPKRAKRTKEVIVIPEEEKNIYCGIRPLNKKQRYGTMKECVDKKKYSRYGLIKIDDNIINQKPIDIPENIAEQLLDAIERLNKTKKK
jgi:hypothetical protein